MLEITLDIIERKKCKKSYCRGLNWESNFLWNVMMLQKLIGSIVVRYMKTLRLIWDTIPALGREFRKATARLGLEDKMAF